jgi:hypothetical protein
MLLPFLIFSQGLKPDKIYVEGKDTLFCWTFPKARILAQQLSNGYYSDEIILEFEQRQDLTDSLLRSERAEKTILLKEKDNYTKIIDNKDKQEKISDQLILMKDVEIKRLKKTNFLYLLSAAILGGILIVK